MALMCLKLPLQWFYLHIGLREMQQGASQALKAELISGGQISLSLHVILRVL